MAKLNFYYMKEASVISGITAYGCRGFKRSYIITCEKDGYRYSHKRYEPAGQETVYGTIEPTFSEAAILCQGIEDGDIAAAG